MKMTGERACVTDRSVSGDSILPGTEDLGWTVGHLRAEWQVPGELCRLGCTFFWGSWRIRKVRVWGWSTCPGLHWKGGKNASKWNMLEHSPIPEKIRTHLSRELGHRVKGWRGIRKARWKDLVNSLHSRHLLNGGFLEQQQPHLVKVIRMDLCFCPCQLLVCARRSWGSWDKPFLLQQRLEDGARFWPKTWVPRRLAAQTKGKVHSLPDHLPREYCLWNTSIPTFPLWLLIWPWPLVWHGDREASEPSSYRNWCPLETLSLELWATCGSVPPSRGSESSKEHGQKDAL